MLLEGDIETSKGIFLPYKKMYLNLKLPGSVLFCVNLGPAHTVPCSVAFQKFWYPAISLDSPFSQGVRIICLMLEKVIIEKLFQTQHSPALPLSEPRLPHESSLGSL